MAQEGCECFGCFKDGALYLLCSYLQGDNDIYYVRMDKVYMVFIVFLCRCGRAYNLMRGRILITDNSLTTRIVCFRPKWRTQCIFPRSQYRPTCLYKY